jgi:anti-anti-sigma regulatory factor
MLVGCSALMEQKGGRMRIACVPGHVARAFAVVRMERIVRLDADVETSCALLANDSAAAG